MRKTATTPRAISKKSLADEVYDRLSGDILAGRQGCGAILSEAGLAVMFQVSRGPVREALRRLAAEGLVENHANRRATVIRPSRDDVLRIYEVRSLLESGAAELAAQRISDESLAAMRETVAKAETLLADSDIERQLSRLVDLDVKFHQQIVAACANDYLTREIARYQRLIRVMQRTGVTIASQQAAWTAHAQVLAALAARDPVRSRQAMQEHIAWACRTVLAANDAASHGECLAR